MNTDNEFKQLYVNTIQQIHASESLHSKIKQLNQASKTKTFVLRKVGIIIAAMLALFISTNAITYAATGSTWLETITKSYTQKKIVIINEKEVEIVGNVKETEAFIIQEYLLPCLDMDISHYLSSDIYTQIYATTDILSYHIYEITHDSPVPETLDTPTSIAETNDEYFLYISDQVYEITDSVINHKRIDSCSGTFTITESIDSPDSIYPVKQITTYEYTLTGDLENLHIQTKFVDMKTY